MSTRRHPKISRRSAEQALDRSGSTGAADVDAVLASAAAPSAGEAPGETGALVAFRAAGLGSSTTTGSVATMKRTTSRLLTAKALAAGVIAVTGVGGVALAATTGHLPNPAAGDHPNLGKSQEAPGHQGEGPATPGNGPSEEPTEAPTEEPTDEPTEDPTEEPTEDPTEEPTTGPEATPSPSLEGLCKAYQAGERSGHPKDLTNPAFGALLEAAGDEGAVSTYCVDLVGEPQARPDKSQGEAKSAEGRANKDAKSQGAEKSAEGRANKDAKSQGKTKSEKGQSKKEENKPEPKKKDTPVD